MYANLKKSTFVGFDATELCWRIPSCWQHVGWWTMWTMSVSQPRRHLWPIHGRMSRQLLLPQFSF